MGDAAQGRAGEGPGSRAAAARVALALGTAAFAFALGPGAPGEAPCAAPAEREAYEGHTTAVACDAPAGPALRGPARMLFGLGVDPNRADARTLEALPGIGPKRAAAIVAERERRPFEDAAALERVPGIGPKTRRAIAPWIATGDGAPPGQNR